MFSCLLSNTLLAGVAALLVWGIARWFRPAPATLHALWLVVMLKLLSPFGLLYPLPLAVDLGGPASPAPPETPPAPVEFTETFFLAELPVEPGEAVVTLPEPPAPAPAPAGQTVARLLLALWAAGALVVAARQAWHTGRFAWRARKARQAPEAVARHAERLARQLGVRPPAVRVLAGLFSPAVWALGRPVLLWPAGLERRLGDGGRDAVLLHELAHLRRGDHWTRWLELAAAVVHWWNPLFWLARRQVRFHAELACDAWVTGTLPAARRAYAEALLEVCSTVSRAAVAPAVGVGGDGRRDFQRRLTMIMRDQVPCRLSGRGKFAAAFLAATLLPGWVFAQKEDPALEPPEADSTREVVADVLFSELAEDAGRAQKLKELEARIAELTKELEALRGNKPEPGKKVSTSGAGVRTADVIYRVVNPTGVRTADVMYRAVKPNRVRVVVIDSATDKILKEFDQESPDADGAIKAADEARRYKQERAEGLEKLAKAKVEAVRVGEKVHRLTLTGGMSGQVVMLSRATYKLPREKAEALAAFIKQHVQAKVLELKTEGDGLTVTTTPEVQRAIGTLIDLMQGGQTSAPRGVSVEGGRVTSASVETHLKGELKPMEFRRIELSPETVKQLRLMVKPETHLKGELKLIESDVPPGLKPVKPAPPPLP